MSVVQGLVTAGTVAYLTRDSTYEKTLLGINYLFYLMGNAGRAAHVQIPFLASSSKALFVLTPFVLPFLIGANQEAPIDEDRSSHMRESSRFEEPKPLNKNRVEANLSVVFIAAAASTLVLVAFGHLAYGAGFFAITALDMLTRQKIVDQTVRKFFTGLAGIPAILSFWSYGLNLSTTPGVQLMVLIAAEVFVPRIYNLFSTGRSSYGGYGYYFYRPSSRTDSRIEEEEPAPPTAPSTEKKFQAIGNLMGPLPHGL